MILLMHLGLDEMLMQARPKVAAWAGRIFARESYETGIEQWLDPAAVDLPKVNSSVARDALARIAA